MIINNMTGGKKYPVTSPEGYINDKGYINGELSTIEKFKTAQGTFPSSGYTSIFYANNKYYSLNGNSNKVAISDDGITWAESTMNINLNNGYYYNIAYGNGKFVVGRGNTFYVSDDCVNWTTVEMPAEEDSGSNWGSDLPFGLQIWDIAYNNGKFVAIGSRESGVDGHGCLLTSSNGINWEEKYYAYSSWLVSGNGKFVLVLEDPGFLTYSEDGIIWDIADVEATDYATYLEYADDKFIFLDVASHKIYHSEDGVTWQESSHSTLSEQNYPSRISGADGLYMISYDDYAIISRDCINWELATEEWMLNAFSCNGKYVTINGTTITYYDYIDEVVIPLPSNTYLDGVEYIDTGVGVIEATEIIPTIENQIIAAGNYLKGDQTIKGDANLIASNIAKGKEIFGVTGAYDPTTTLSLKSERIEFTKLGPRGTGSDVLSVTIPGRIVMVFGPISNSDTNVYGTIKYNSDGTRYLWFVGYSLGEVAQSTSLAASTTMSIDVVVSSTNKLQWTINCDSSKRVLSAQYTGKELSSTTVSTTAAFIVYYLA